MMTNTQKEQQRPPTIEQLHTLCSLSISDETLGKVIREALGRKLSPAFQKSSAITESGAEKSNHKDIEVKSHNANGITITDHKDHNPPEGKPVIVEIHIAGKRSTVSITKSVFDAYERFVGSAQVARQHIRDSVSLMPPGVSKPSVWIQDFLKSEISK